MPQDAIEGSVQALVKIYPSSFSQLVEGLDAIFQMPYGCFEQTSSTTYPNVLALDYLRRTNKAVPEVEAKARQYIHLGYQRLLSFEIAGGGFDWFGTPPANRTLTAYGLMEFQDMARVHDVDPNLIERTRRWLLEQQKPDGSWDAEQHMLHEDPTRGRPDQPIARLSTTAYIAWAVFAGHENESEVPGHAGLPAESEAGVDRRPVHARSGGQRTPGSQPGGRRGTALPRPARSSPADVRRRQTGLVGFRPGPTDACSTGAAGAGASRPRRWPPWPC